MDIPAGERSRRQGSDILGGQTPTGTSGVWPSKASEQGDVDTLAVRLRKSPRQSFIANLYVEASKGRGLSKLVYSYYGRSGAIKHSNYVVWQI